MELVTLRIYTTRVHFHSENIIAALQAIPVRLTGKNEWLLEKQFESYIKEKQRLKLDNKLVEWKIIDKECKITANLLQFITLNEPISFTIYLKKSLQNTR